MSLTQSSKVFASLEKKIGDKIPKIIKHILELSSYDSKGTLQLICGDSITEIECFVNENYERIRNSFEETAYDNINPFKFTPGHRALILSFPNHIKKSNHRERIQNNENLVVRADDDDKLKKQLVDKLEKYSKNRGFEFGFTLENIKNFHFKEEKNKYKCEILCSKCSKLTPCHYKKHWEVSNLIKHFKDKHIEVVITATNVNNQNRILLLQQQTSSAIEFLNEN